MIPPAFTGSVTGDTQGPRKDSTDFTALCGLTLVLSYDILPLLLSADFIRIEETPRPKEISN